MIDVADMTDQYLSLFEKFENDHQWLCRKYSSTSADGPASTCNSTVANMPGLRK